MLGGLYLLNVIGLLYEGEEGQSCDIHTVLDLCLTSEAGLELLLTLDAVDGSSSAAEAATASDTANQLIAGILHSVHDSEAGGYFIFFTIEVNVNHIFHTVCSPILIFVGKLIELVKAEHRSILTDEL